MRTGTKIAMLAVVLDGLVKARVAVRGDDVSRADCACDCDRNYDCDTGSVTRESTGTVADTRRDRTHDRRRELFACRDRSG